MVAHSFNFSSQEAETGAEARSLKTCYLGVSFTEAEIRQILT